MGTTELREAAGVVTLGTVGTTTFAWLGDPNG